MNSLYHRAENVPSTATTADLALLEVALRNAETSSVPQCTDQLAFLDDTGRMVGCCILGSIAETKRAEEGASWSEDDFAPYNARSIGLSVHVAAAYRLNNRLPNVDLSRLDETTAQELHAIIQDADPEMLAVPENACVALSGLNDAGARRPLLARVARQGLIPLGER